MNLDPWYVVERRELGEWRTFWVGENHATAIGTLSELIDNGWPARLTFTPK